MAKYKIIFERKDCIGAATCTAAAPEFWKIEERTAKGLINLQGKADLIDSDYSSDIQERIIDEKDLAMNLSAANSCPVHIIHIINLETGEKII